MGWGRMLLMGNVGQQLDIGDLNNAVDEMRNSVQQNQSVDEEQEQSIESLRKENHEMKLYMATLLRMLVAKGILNQEEIDTTVQAVEKT